LYFCEITFQVTWRWCPCTRYLFKTKWLMYKAMSSCLLGSAVHFVLGNPDHLFPHLNCWSAFIIFSLPSMPLPCSLLCPHSTVWREKLLVMKKIINLCVIDPLTFVYFVYSEF
jgi:hypothetical protein